MGTSVEMGVCLRKWRCISENSWCRRGRAVLQNLQLCTLLCDLFQKCHGLPGNFKVLEEMSLPNEAGMDMSSVISASTHQPGRNRYWGLRAFVAVHAVGWGTGWAPAPYTPIPCPPQGCRSSIAFLQVAWRRGCLATGTSRANQRCFKALRFLLAQKGYREIRPPCSWEAAPLPKLSVLLGVIFRLAELREQCWMGKAAAEPCCCPGAVLSPVRPHPPWMLSFPSPSLILGAAGVLNP